MVPVSWDGSEGSVGYKNFGVMGGCVVGIWRLRGNSFSVFNLISSKEINNFHLEISKPPAGELISWGWGNQPRLCLGFEGPWFCNCFIVQLSYSMRQEKQIEDPQGFLDITPDTINSYYCKIQALLLPFVIIIESLLCVSYWVKGFAYIIILIIVLWGWHYHHHHLLNECLPFIR